MTHLQAYKQREQQQRQEILRIMQVDDEYLNHLIFDGAYEYLRNVFGTDAYGMEHLPKTSEFWTWWRMEWNRIDRIFLESISHKYASQYPQWYTVIRSRDADQFYAVHSVKDLHQWYDKYHEASMGNRYINSSVVRAGAHEMINSIIAGKTKQQEVNHE